MESDKVSAHEKAVEAAIIAGSRRYDEGDADWDEQYRAAISAYLAAMRQEGWIMVPTIHATLEEAQKLLKDARKGFDDAIALAEQENSK